MKVSSPIGELPFEPRKLRFRKTGIEMEGVMGTWPARVQISGKDIPLPLKTTFSSGAIGSVFTAIFGRRDTPSDRKS